MTVKLKANCGCGFTVEAQKPVGTPDTSVKDAFKAAVSHATQTGHVVQFMGEVR